jgi:hypothetical protein
VYTPFLGIYIILLQALKPKEGRFLPAAAALGGLLFLAPDGHYAAEHDVLQLQASLLALKQQQGYITCQSKPDVSGWLPVCSYTDRLKAFQRLHCCLHALLLTTVI